MLTIVSMQSCNTCQDTFEQGWRNGEEKIIELTNVETDDEGKVSCLLMLVVCLNAGMFCVQASLFFSIAGNQRFTLHCPTSYPDYQVNLTWLGSKITFTFHLPIGRQLLCGGGLQSSPVVQCPE